MGVGITLIDTDRLFQCALDFTCRKITLLELG